MATTVAQLVAEIRADLNEPRPLNFLPTPLLTWINDGVQAVCTEMHGLIEDWLTRRMLSTDSAETLQGESYDPASLTITAATTTYTLPPNVIEIRRLEPASQTDKDRGVGFSPKNLSHSSFLQASRTSASTYATSYLYTTTGMRTLVIAPTPAAGVSIPIELWYVALPEAVTSSSAFTVLPVQVHRAVKAYVVWKAFESINSPDMDIKLQTYKIILKEVISLMSPRQTAGVVIVEGIFDEEDSWFDA